MARSWEPKGPNETVERRWGVDLDIDDSISAVSAVGSGVTIADTAYDATDAIITLSGGTEETTASVTVTVTTNDGETFVETFLIVISAPAQQFSYTARDIIYFAMRKITGNGEDPDADEADDALERLNDMLAMWRIEGIDLGVPVLALGSTITVPDAYISAIKFNLRVSCHSHYGEDVSAYDAEMAESGKRVVINNLFDLKDVELPRTLSGPYYNDVADLF